MIAWETFGVANGVASMAEMGRRVRALRRDDGRDDRVGCVVLSGVTILPPELRPAAPADFQSNTVRGAGFDLTLGDPKRAWDQLLALSAPTPFASPIISVPGGYHDPAFAKARRGQGAFRLMVMDSYDRRCAITGERTLPVLEAAHIKPFAGEQTHEVANGKVDAIGSPPAVRSRARDGRRTPDLPREFVDRARLLEWQNLLRFGRPNHRDARSAECEAERRRTRMALTRDLSALNVDLGKRPFQIHGHAPAFRPSNS